MQIKIEFSQSLALFLSFVVILVYCFWLFYTKSNKDKSEPLAEHVQQCPYCLYIFIQYDPNSIWKCPRCNSLLEKVVDDET
jgi:hypothetical protein